MMRTTVPLSRVQTIAQDTTAVTFGMPAGFAFTAGHYVTVTLPQLVSFPLPDQHHDFSIASAPFELPELTIAFRNSFSPFKKTLLSMHGGEVVEIAGPKGVFILPQDTTVPIVAIAGGTGITPFVSMLRQMQHDGVVRPFTLYYFNRTKDRALYLDELQDMSIATVIPMFETVSASTLADIAHDAHIYVAGPPSMVRTVRTVLDAKKINGTHIMIEEFVGYE